MVYIKIPLDGMLMIDKIISVYDMELAADYRYEGESHDFWEMIYVVNGTVTVRSGESTLSMSAREIALHRPYSFHAVSCDGVTGARVIIVGFESRSVVMNAFPAGAFLIPGELTPVVFGIVEAARECFVIGKNPLVPLSSPPIGARQILRSSLECLLLRLLRNVGEGDGGGLLFTSQEALEKRLVDDIMGFLRESLGDRLSLDDIAEHFHFGKSHICHVFKARTGKTVLGTFLEMKVEHARELLRTTDLTVAEIAEQLGFESPQYFSKVYKRLMGEAPSAVRSRIARYTFKM